MALWTGAATVENSMDVSQKAKTRTNIWPSNFTPGYIPTTKKKKKKPKNWFEDKHAPECL